MSASSLLILSNSISFSVANENAQRYRPYQVADEMEINVTNK
ncbi:hypothetical protein [Bacillus sp. T2.9-1]|nr:hypothetical protein [Bacillus sp. T2.9-1]